MIEAKDMSKELSSDLLHVALVGPENNGKSVLGTTAPGVKLFLDFDQKRNAIAGKKDTYAITFKDPPWPKMPESAEEVLDIMSGLEKSLDLYNLTDKKGNKILPEVKEGTMVQSIFFDSMASFGKSIMTYELYNNADMRRELKIGPSMAVHVPKNFDAWNAEMKGVEQIVMRAFALPINVFCIFHEKPEEAADSTIEKPKYTGRVTVFPVRYKDLLIKYFTDIWRVRLTPVATGNGVSYLPRVYVLPDFALDSGTSMKLDAVEEPDITKMIAKHRSRVSVSTPQGPIVVANKSQ
jgi:AAA domain-containing protein